MSVKEIYHPDSNRVGRMLIPFGTLRDERELIGALLSLCVVLDAEDHESGRGKAYTCASDLFQALGEGEEIPEYRVEFAHDDVRPQFDDPTWETQFPVLRSGKFRFVAIRRHIVRVPTARVGHAMHATKH